MRKLMFAFVTLLSFASFGYGQTPNMDWYTTDPSSTKFTISTADQLAGLANIVNAGTDNFQGKTVTLIEAVSLEGYANWTPIGTSSTLAFQGTFDGGKHAISYLATHGMNAAARGLFGYVNGGVLKNVNLVNASIISSAANAGTLAGHITGSSVTSCYATGTVTGPSNTSSDLAVGGLIGYAKGSKLSVSYFSGSVSSLGSFVGGLVGRLETGNSIFNSYSTGSVSGNRLVGGLVGHISNSTDSVYNSYSASTVIGTNEYISGLVGASDGNGHIYNSAALNPEVKGGFSGYAYRISGGNTNRTSNVALAEMTNSSGDTVWSNKGLTNASGADISLAEVLADGTIGNRFTGANGWIVANGKLPVLSAGAEQPKHFTTIYRIIVRSNVSASKGGTHQSFAEVFGVGSNRAVEWSVSGVNISNVTTISNTGLLTIGANETATTLTVKATSVAEPEVSGSITVAVVDSKYGWYTNAIAANPAAKTFTISTAAELEALANIVNGTWGGLPAKDDFSGKTITLTSAISLSGYSNWVPIGNDYTFSGTFDGGHHAISKLFINRNSAYQGLFGRVSNGTLRKVSIVNADITGTSTVGGLVGTYSGIISNSSFSGSVSGTSSVGGLAGSGSYSRDSISNCYSTGFVRGTDYVGGLVGTTSTVSNSYSTSFVSGGNYVGGLASGYSVSISNSAALNPEVKGTGTNVGRIAGSGTHTNNLAFAEMGNFYNDTVWVNKGASAIDGNNLLLSSIKENGTISGRFTKENGGWAVEPGKLPGFGEAVELPNHFTADVYRVAVRPVNPSVTNGGTLQLSAVAFGEGANKNVQWSVLDKTSNLTSISNTGLLTVGTNENPGVITVVAKSEDTPSVSGSMQITIVDSKYEWYTANPNATSFSISKAAELEGLANIVNGTWGGVPTKDNFSGKTITLTSAISLSGYSNWTPIGNNNYTYSSYNVFSGTFDGGNYAISGLATNHTNYAGLFGYVNAGTLRKVSLVNANVRGASSMGSLVGYINGRVIDCNSSNIDVRGTSSSIGGLVGEKIGGGAISNSYSSGFVNGLNYVGGLVGLSTDSVSNSHFIGSVSGTGTGIDIGGLVGQSVGVISNSYSSGTVSNSGNSTGGLIGRFASSSTGKISNSYSTSSVNGKENTGGLIGYNEGGTVSNCYSTGSVNGTENVGGLIGYIYYSTTISDNAALNSEVKGTGLNIGRVVGFMQSTATLTNNVAFSDLGNNVNDNVWANKGAIAKDGLDMTLSAIQTSASIGSRFVGNGWTTAVGKLPGFGAAIDFPEHFTADAYRVAILPPTPAAVAGETILFSAKVFGRSTEKGVTWSLEGADAFTTINEAGLLTVAAGESAPIFTVVATSKANKDVLGTANVSLVDSKYGWYTSGRLAISTVEELASLAEIVNGTWAGARDDFAGKTITLAANIDLESYHGQVMSWVPIGNYSANARNVFRGTFDGKGHTINNMLINRDSTYRGLFGLIENGTVKNLGLINVNVSGGQYTGGIVGYTQNSRIDSSYVTGKVTGGQYTGGIVGFIAAKSRVFNSYSNADVTGNGYYKGGLAGVVITESMISNSYSTGTVSGTYAGGIAGEVGNNSSVINSYATGAVSGSPSGGIVGYLNGSNAIIANCAALNSKVGNSNAYRIAYRYSGTLSNNVAFAEMKNGSDATTWSDKGANNQNGADIAIGEIAFDGTIGKRFIAANGWTTKNGYLPGFGKLNNYPAHLPPQIITGQEPEFPTVTLGITYKAGLILDDIELSEGYRWVDSSISVYAGNNQQFDANYAWNYPEPITGKITLNVAKAPTAPPTFVNIPEITVQYVENLTLANIPLPPNYEWANPANVITKESNQQFQAQYVNANYTLPVQGTVRLLVSTGYGFVAINDWIYGEEPSEPEAFTTTNGNVVLSYSGVRNNGTQYNSLNKPTDAGNYIITATFAAANGHEAIMVKQAFTIHRAPGTGTVSIESWKMGDPLKEPVVSGSTNPNVSFIYKSYPGASYAAQTSQPANPGRYMLIATFQEGNNYAEHKDTTYFTIGSNQAIQLTVTWSEDTVFTYNKMLQHPVPTVMHGNDTIALTLLNAQSEVGKYNGMLRARAIIEDEVLARDFVLLNNVKAYEIKQKPLAARFKVARPTDNYDANADTIWVPSRIFSNLDTLRKTLEGIIDYEGFAIDTVKKESDDVSVLKGKPTVEVGYVRSSLFSALTKRVETTQKATATIVTDDMSANNYELTRKNITVMEAIIEASGAEQIFCNRNSKYVLMGEMSCNTIGGTAFTKLFCVFDNKCVQINDDMPIAACDFADGDLVPTCPVESPIDVRYTQTAPTIRVWQTASGIVNMDLGYMPAKPVSVQIYDLKGKLVATEYVNTRFANVRVNVSGGMYLFKVGNMAARVPVM